MWIFFSIKRKIAAISQYRRKNIIKKTRTLLSQLISVILINS